MSRSTETVDRALDIAGEILLEGGEASLRLEEVARKSRVSMGSLYHHFGSRRGLIRAAHERQFARSLPAESSTETTYLLAAVDLEDFIERLTSGLVMSQTPARAASRRRRLELLGAAATRPAQGAAIRAAQTAYLDDAERVGRFARSRGWLRSDVDPRSFAWFLHALSMGRVLGELDERIDDPESLVRIAVTAVRGLMRPDAASSA